MSLDQTESYRFLNFELNVPERLLMRDGHGIPLTDKVFETLCVLVRRGGSLVSKDELLTAVWPDAIVEENNLDKCISRLRKTLGEKKGERDFIETVRGHGWRFVAPVQVIDAVSSGTVRECDTEIRIIAPPSIRPSPVVESGWRSVGRRGAALLVVLCLIAVAVYFFNRNVSATPPGVRSIAVLTFRPLLTGANNEGLEYGTAETLISRLGSDNSIAVRPTVAVNATRFIDKDALAIGRTLGVDLVLDGTMQNEGGRIRVAAKLLQTVDGRHLWQGYFDEPSARILAVQDSISDQVAAALKIPLGRDSNKHPTENVEAYEAYMKGRYHNSKHTGPELHTSIRYLKRAVEIDPRYAMAYAELSTVYRTLAISGEMSSTEVRESAKAAALKALEIDSSSSSAHGALGGVLFWMDWDWQAAENEYKEALRLDPNNSEVHLFYAHMLSNTGRHAEALEQVKLSRELNPLALYTSALEGQFLLHAGKADEALERLKSTMELEPNFWMPYFFSESVYIEKAMFQEAINASKKEREMTGENVIPFGAYAYAMSGRPRAAREALDEMLHKPRGRYLSPYNVALIYSGLTEKEKAITWLERAFDERDPKITFLKVEPKWDRLRSDPRFAELMSKMRFDQ